MKADINWPISNIPVCPRTRCCQEQGQIAVFFIDFAINAKRTKSLLRDIIAAKAAVFWVAQISANLLRDEELVDLIAASGGKWIFIGMESVDPVNLKDVNKRFNKPGEYATVPYYPEADKRWIPLDAPTKSRRGRIISR